MNASIGLAVASDELRVVLVRDAAVEWAARAARDDDAPLAAQVTALLDRVPSSRWRRRRVTAAVGPSAVQVKRLGGLPPLTDRAAISALVRESASRFFLRNGVPLDVAEVWMPSADTVWAAAFDATVVCDVAEGCRGAGFGLRAILPAVAVLGTSLADSELTWPDGELRAELTFASGVLTGVRRVACETVELPPPSPIAALARAGDEAWRLADAYGAALAPAIGCLALCPTARGGHARERRGIFLAAAACLAAFLSALIAPGMSASIDTARAAREMRAVAAPAREAAAAAQDYERMSRALAFADAFAAGRRPPLALLAHLTQSLPEGAALVTLRTDSAGGTLVLLAPHAARAVAAMEHVSGIAGLEITGPVTKEVDGARELERATVRFRFAPEPAP